MFSLTMVMSTILPSVPSTLLTGRTLAYKSKAYPTRTSLHQLYPTLSSSSQTDLPQRNDRAAVLLSMGGNRRARTRDSSKHGSIDEAHGVDCCLRESRSGLHEVIKPSVEVGELDCLGSEDRGEDLLS